MLRNYAIISSFIGIIGWLFFPGYDPRWDFGLSLILLALHRMGTDGRKT